jgi:hypothetical protein
MLVSEVANFEGNGLNQAARLGAGARVFDISESAAFLSIYSIIDSIISFV